VRFSPSMTYGCEASSSRRWIPAGPSATDQLGGEGVRGTKNAPMKTLGTVRCPVSFSSSPWTSCSSTAYPPQHHTLNTRRDTLVGGRVREKRSSVSWWHVRQPRTALLGCVRLAAWSQRRHRAWKRRGCSPIPSNSIATASTFNFSNKLLTCWQNLQTATAAISLRRCHVDEPNPIPMRW
jgi:hypothetical protein